MFFLRVYQTVAPSSTSANQRASAVTLNNKLLTRCTFDDFFRHIFLTPLLLFLYVCIFLGPTWQVSDPSSSLAAQIMFSVIRPPVDCRGLQTMFVIVSVMLKCFEISQWFLQTDGFPSSRPFFAPASHSKTTFCVAHRNESRLQQSRRCLETGF